MAVTDIYIYIYIICVIIYNIYIYTGTVMRTVYVCIICYTTVCTVLIIRGSNCTIIPGTVSYPENTFR
jgi:hypothetical protein